MSLLDNIFGSLSSGMCIYYSTRSRQSGMECKANGTSPKYFFLFNHFKILF